MLSYGGMCKQSYSENMQGMSVNVTHTSTQTSNLLTYSEV